MPTDLTREEIERLRVDFDRGHDLGYGDQRALLAHALAEPARLAAARAEGVREGIEMAAQVASNAAWRYEDDDASMTGGPEAGARYQVGECVKAIKALSPVPTWTPTHRHYKGGLYREIMRCEGADGDDLVPVVIYENEVGRRFARDAAVFDGQIVKQDAGGLPYLDVRRFEPIAPAPAEAPTTPTVEASSEERVAVWVRRCFGDAAMSIHERASRLMEEAIEMAQAAGVAREVANRSVAYIYGRRRGRRCRNSAASC